ncbi:MAG: eukaryotic-like serine/threonine-protein kinase [Streptomyces sp.]|nr:eukaryotic-like serine/threonine-protein kinase [Streptomyces sp.]
MASDGGYAAFPDPSPPGVIVGRYRITGRLGRGGMGTVWRAEDELLGRQVAVKELLLDDDMPDDERRGRSERALREARAAARIKHPHVIVLHDVVEQDGSPWIVMELVDGRSLAEILAKDGPVPPREAARIGAAVTGALHAAHAHGVLHRDIKPANVLIENGTGRVVLTDFGIARMLGSTTLTEAGAFVGSPEYTAPERMSGQSAGPASDMWSLGVLLCAAVRGQSPFRRDSLGGVLHAVVFDEIKPPVELGTLLPVVTGLLERDPERRMSAPDAEERLRGYADPPDPPDASTPPADIPAPSAPTTTTPAPAAPSIPLKPRRRTPLILAALSIVVVGALGAVALVQNQNHHTANSPALAATAPGRAAGATANAASPSSSSSPSPGQSPATATAGATATPVPAGYRLAVDPKGFSLAVPDAFTRSYQPPRVFYFSPGEVFRIGIRTAAPGSGGPLAVMNAQHADGPGTYKGYRDGFVTETTRAGNPAALWEFTWDGFGDGGGARRTYDLCWTEGGRQYDVWVSSPVAKAELGREYFDTARDTFRPDQARN